MSWIGAGIGALLGAQRGSILGGIIGAVIGNWVEGKVRNFVGASDGNASSGGNASASPNELATLAAISAMLAKLAKADGRITADEVRYCEQVFDRLGLHGEKREYCIRVFRTAKSDSHSIYEYAASFASAQPGAQIREIVYAILWDLACVDGVASPEEVAILREIVSYLRLDPSLFAWESRRHGVFAEGGGGSAPSEPDPYEVLGCSQSATDDELRRAYREKAKQLHPDVLRAQGLSDELISRASEQMARLNAAWATLRQKRRL